MSEHGPRRAIVYVGRDAEPGLPKPGYMEGIVEAAEALGLPPSYRAELNSWNPERSRTSFADKTCGAAALGGALKYLAATRAEFEAEPSPFARVRKTR